MNVTGVRELKSRLSAYLRLVKQGELVLITEHGRVIAQIAPPPAHLGPALESEDQSLQRLVRAGRLSAAEPGAPSWTRPPLPAPSAAVDLRAAIEALREDREPV